MAAGTVKWFSAIKEFGPIQPEDGSNDVFVHATTARRAGLATLKEGQRLQYELVRGKNGKTSAMNLKVV